MFRHKDTPIVFFLADLLLLYEWGITCAVYIKRVCDSRYIPCDCLRSVNCGHLPSPCACRVATGNRSAITLCLNGCVSCVTVLFSWCWCTNFIKRLPILQTISCVIQLATLVDVPLFQSTASVYIEADKGTRQFYIGLHTMANVQNGAIWTQSETLSSKLRKWPSFFFLCEAIVLKELESKL